MKRATTLDLTDLKILRELQRDGRLTNVELASRIGLSPPPCLRRVQVLAGVTVALPAHGDPFNNVSARVTDIIQHHNERLETLVIASKEMGRPATVAEMMQRLFRERSWGTMAESETYAHLEHLRILGEASVERHSGDLEYQVSHPLPMAALTGD